MIQLIRGDCLEKMKELPDNSIDSVVTDPPYGLSFMGKSWDYDVPEQEIWEECLRVLKPGGYLLAFAGTRTQHRMAVRIEDAGFEIRDMIAWVYGSGFPKSLNVGKAIDKDAAMATAAKQWRGWGTALKPALEPITVARKPLIGTVAANVLKHGTGGINIDGCRVATAEVLVERKGGFGNANAQIYGKSPEGHHFNANGYGRFPANLIHDGSDEVLELFPESIARPVSSEKIGISGSGQSRGLFGNGSIVQSGYNDIETSAARFFYCAKTSKSERGTDNNHPTVKPTDLMCYLCRLVTPPNGTVLDPFMGSGSTGKAARIEGFDFIGIELDEEYFNIAKERIETTEPLIHDNALTNFME